MERREPDDGKLSRPVLRGGRGGNVAPPLGAFGNSVGGSGSSPNPFIWNGGSGYYSDAESELQKVGARFYDPAVGRWISQDTLLVAGSPADSQALNRYCYCGDSPIAGMDPSGHGVYSELGSGVGAIIGGAIGGGIGALFGGVGAPVGGAIGGVIGSDLGGWLGGHFGDHEGNSELWEEGAVHTVIGALSGAGGVKVAVFCGKGGGVMLWKACTIRIVGLFKGG